MLAIFSNCLWDPWVSLWWQRTGSPLVGDCPDKRWAVYRCDPILLFCKKWQRGWFQRNLGRLSGTNEEWKKQNQKNHLYNDSNTVKTNNSERTGFSDQWNDQTRFQKTNNEGRWRTEVVEWDIYYVCVCVYLCEYISISITYIYIYIYMRPRRRALGRDQGVPL